MLDALTFVGEQAFIPPEDLCRFGSASRESLAFTLSDKLWQALRNRIHIRKLPATSKFIGGLDDNISSLRRTQIFPVKSDFLSAYIPAFTLRRRVRALWARVLAFWHAWVPEATDSFRPGLTDVELARVERELAVELPEDYAESLRCHDGQRDGSWWFASTALQQPAVWVLRLLPLHEALEEARSMPFDGCVLKGVPLAVTPHHDSSSSRLQERNGTIKCQTQWLCLGKRLEENASTSTCMPQPIHQYGEVWQYDADDSANIMESSKRHASCFLDYLSSYVDFLESVPAQFAAQGGYKSQEVLGPVLRHLFALPSIECCNQDGQWATTGLGMGKGNSWYWSGKHASATIAFPRLSITKGPCGSKRRACGKK